MNQSGVYLTLIGALVFTLGIGCSKLSNDPTSLQSRKCNSCHGVPPSDTLHTNHVKTQGIDCYPCHEGASAKTAVAPSGYHGNGVADVVFHLPSDSTGTPRYDSATGSCSSVSCHAAVTGCGTCHSVPPADTVHSIHTEQYGCAACHSGYAKDSTNTRYHANGNTDVVFTYVYDSLESGTFDLPTGQCDLVYCHGNFPGGTRATVAPTDTISGCRACHDIDGMLSEGHAKHTFKYIVSECQNCHPGYSLDSNRVNLDIHANGMVDTAGCAECHRF